MSIFKKIFGKETKQRSEEIKPQNELDGSRGEIILEFKKSIQQSIEWSELKQVKFAMWIPCEQDKQFATSPIIAKWNVVYSLTKNYWSFIAADLLKTLKLLDEKVYRIGFPDDFQAFAFLTITGEQIILSLSQEKGIRLHFSETTSLEYRVLFLDNFIAYCNAWKGIVELSNGKLDNDTGAEGWWSFNLSVSLTLEKKEPLTGVGIIVK